MDMAEQMSIPLVQQERIKLLKDLNLTPSPAMAYAPIFAYLSRKGVDSSSNPIYAMKTQSSNLSIAGEHGDCNGERTGK